MKDEVNGRLYRGPGEPPLFRLADQEVDPAHEARATWIREMTGVAIDPFHVQLTERTRRAWYASPVKQLPKRQQHWMPLPNELRTSERRTFKTCPKQWEWRYVDWLTPKRVQTPLWFGTLWHDALAKWYLKGTKRGPHPAETFSAMAESEVRPMLVVDEEGETEFITGRDLGVAMANNYIDRYGRDEHMEILAIEQTYTLLFKRQGRAFLRYLLTMDGLYRDLRTGLIWILEHKTAKAIKVSHLHLDDQAGSYYAAAPIVLDLPSLIGSGRISGIMYNFARKGLKDERPLNAEGQATNKPQKQHYVDAIQAHTGETLVGRWTLDRLSEEAQRLGLTVLGDVSKDQPAELFRREPVFRTVEEQRTQLQRIQDEALYMERMRAGDPAYPIYKTPGDHCAWCPFQRMCELDEQGDDVAVHAFQEAMMTKTDPYEQYRRKAA